MISNNFKDHRPCRLTSSWSRLLSLSLGKGFRSGVPEHSCACFPRLGTTTRTCLGSKTWVRRPGPQFDLSAFGKVWRWQVYIRCQVANLPLEGSRQAYAS